MKLEKIELVNFRNYAKKSFSFSLTVVILGENGSGKSNLLEAIYLLATGKSFRADVEEEMVKYEAEFSILNYSFDSAQDKQLLNSKITIYGGRKKFEVNRVPRRMADFVGKIRAVLFGPRDLDLIEGSPGLRRRYLDFVLTQTDLEYRRNLVSYEKGVRQRNKILENIREGLASRNQLFFWDKLLIKNGEYITEKRGEYLDSLIGEYRVEYDKSIISEARLKQYEMEEVAAATTLVGPHRDDFVIFMNDRDVAKYGSRGEQRMAVLWLKKGERNWLTVDQKEIPLLLLDDVFSELDHQHREEVEKMVEEQVASRGQVIMTTTDEHLLPAHEKWEIIRL